ncbi:hypothetical protein [Paenibacillus glucanolyticus]|uniref:hypothetical protein n=1 Tax=Paenibacillus glucanolyticus TaxID=59843 RepID=UPI00096F8049|nr:hypothetical protein [Paenibacillus glucanolyticus]OMF81579.1 hypothetical protein BK142_03635 [Paenibacillus glucanolyticus]
MFNEEECLRLGELIEKIVKSEGLIKNQISDGDIIISFMTNASEQLNWAKYYQKFYYKFSEYSTERTDCLLLTGFYPEIYYEILNFVNDKCYTKEASYRGDSFTEYSTNNMIVQVYDNRPGLTLLDKENKTIVFLTTLEDKHFIQEPARLIREIFNRENENIGAYQFHGGAVTIQNNGILICGEKGAGKTTTVTGLIEDGRTDFVANDRVLLSIKENKTMIKGIPFAVAIRLGTCYNSPYLRKWLEPTAEPILGFRHSNLKISDIESFSDVERWNIKQFIELTPEELILSYNTQVKSTAQLKMIIFPEVNKDYKNPYIDKPSKEWAKSVLFRECFTIDDDSYNDRFGLLKEITKEGLENTFDTLLNNVSIYSIKYSNIHSTLGDIYQLILDEIKQPNLDIL